MKTEFIQPRFDGARFDEHTLPVEVARDLAAYETLVIELAKHLYLTEHPNRKRVPKNFSAGFHLHLDRIEDGSARPVLSIVVAGALALAGGERNYFESARDIISDCIAAPDGQLPPQFPKDLLGHFNQLGRSLREGERLELPRRWGAAAELTPEKRRKLVLAGETEYEREVELAGSIGEADWEKSTFRLRMPDNSTCIVPMPPSFHPLAREYGGRTRHQVQVKAVATFDSWERLQKVVDVESLDIILNPVIGARFDELAELQRGWYDGQGEALAQDKLQQIAEQLIAHYPERLPLPAIVATPEGNLLLEWTVDGSPSLDIQLQDLSAEFHAFVPPDQELERQFQLVNDAQWQELFVFLSEVIRAA